MFGVTNPRVKRKLIDTSKAIREKYKLLKLGIREKDEALQKLFRPVITPIKDISSKLDRTIRNSPRSVPIGKVEETIVPKEEAQPKVDKGINTVEVYKQKTYGRKDRRISIEFNSPAVEDEVFEIKPEKSEYEEGEEEEDSVAEGPSSILEEQENAEALPSDFLEMFPVVK